MEEQQVLVSITIQGTPSELNTLAKAAEAATGIVFDHADGKMKFNDRILAGTLLDTVNAKLMEVVLAEAEVTA
jgi:hypothetical protein